MTQFRLDEQKTSITVLMVVLALSSLGFAVLGLVLVPDLSLDLDPGLNIQLEVARPEVPDLSHLGDVWIDMGFVPNKSTMCKGAPPSLIRSWSRGRRH